MKSTQPNALISDAELKTNWAPLLLSVFRVVMGVLFISHGIVKLFGFPAGASPGKGPLFSLFGAAAILELVGGVLVTLGFFTRPTSFLLCGEMAFAYFTVHAPRGFYPVLNGGELALLYCFGFLYLSAAGAGNWSVDAHRRS